MLVGLLASVLMFGFARTFGEPQVERAIAFEAALDEAKARADAARGIHDIEEPELVSRPMQASYGLLTGVVVYGAAFGGLFALVFAFANGRLGGLGPRGVSALLGLAGFVAFSLVPGLKYPANPPSIGHPDTIGFRTELYFIMMALSIAAMVGAVLVQRHLAPRHGAWNAGLAGAGFFGACACGVAALLPAVTEVPASFPADLLWKFRVDAYAMQAILWGVLGLGFGAWTERAARSRHHALWATRH